MSWDQLGLDLFLLEGPDLQEAELVKSLVLQQLASDRGGAVLSALIDFYLESSSIQAVALLSTVREQLHKTLLEKLNDCLNKAATRLAALMLLGHMIRKQPPWVHLVTRCPLLASLLRCLKTDSDVVVLTTGVLLLVTLLPMIPQCSKQHVYDFFDVFGRLASWTLRNPAQVPALQLLHLQGALYSLFHRLYGMFPVNFLSYLRLHYSMKENRDSFHHVVKPMLDHVRVHPELVTGTRDEELDPSRWKCYEVHDIVMECSRLSLDPLEASSEDLLCPSSPLLQRKTSSDPRSSVPQLSLVQLQAVDLSWSPLSHCSLSTPPPEGSTPSASGPAPSLGVKCPSQASVPVAPSPTLTPISVSLQQPITALEGRSQSHVQSEELLRPGLLTAALIPSPSAPGPAPSAPDQSYEALFELALPRAAPLFIAKKTKEALLKAELDLRPDQTSVSPLELLDQLILQGDQAHQHLVRSVMNKSVERSPSGSSTVAPLSPGPAPGPAPTVAPGLAPAVAPGEELSTELLLVQSQLQFERFKRQQHALRNRRLLRRVITTTALEEQAHALRAQLGVMEAEMRSLRDSLEEEQRRFAELSRESHRTTSQLQAHIQQLSSDQQGALQDKARLQSELQQSQTRLKELEVELQRANHKADNSEHRLTRLSLKVSSGEQLQQQLYLMNQQMVLLRETNQVLTQALHTMENGSDTEASLLLCIMGNEVHHLKESEVQLKQALEATNQRAADLETQLVFKDQLILDQKKLLEDCKALSRSQLSASESRCVALRSISHSLQTEILQLFTQVHLRPAQSQDQSQYHSQDQSQDLDQDRCYSRPRPSASVNIANGANANLKPLYSPQLESPLAVGSFLEREARRLFGSSNQSPEPEEAGLEEQGAGPEEEEGQEVQEETLLAGSPQARASTEQTTSPDHAHMITDSTHISPGPTYASPGPAHTITNSTHISHDTPHTTPDPAHILTDSAHTTRGPAHSSTDLTLTVRQRILELSLMDYDKTSPES